MSHPKNKPVKSHKADLMTGVVWAVAMRWSVRGVGLISTAILARVLQPQDYGIVSMAFLVVGFVDTFLNTGAGAALVRLGSHATVEQINSAWTLRGLQGCVMALVLATVAPLSAIYFHEPRITPILFLVSVCQAFMGFSNIGMALAYRDLQFAVDFKQTLYTKIISVTITLLASFYFRDYRGLVCGIVGGFVSEWLLSYHLHPYRPRWCTKRIRDIWDISKWLLVTGIGGFFLRKTDQLMAGRVGNTQQYGLYTVGSDIGLLPAGELGPTLTRPLFPILAAMQHDWESAKAATLKTMGSVNSITMPLGFGLAAVSEQATLVLLGEQWKDATPFVAGFAIIGVVQYIVGPLNTLLNVAGHVRIQSRIVWIEFLVFVTLAVLLTSTYHLQGLMFARIGSGIVQAVLMIYAARTYTHLSLHSTLSTLVRPLSGAFLMYGLLVTFGHWVAHPTANLVYSIMLGTISYASWLLMTWHLAGRPDGIEATARQLILTKFSHIFCNKK
jgi:O-antigen/teichoic acid export membrane protein